MSTHALPAVLQVVGPRSPLVPEDAHQPLRLVLGESLILEVDLRYSTGPAVDLSSDTRTVLLTVKVRSSDGVAVLSQVATKTPADGIGRCTFSFSAADLFCLSQPRYVYDVWLVEDDGDLPPTVISRNVVVPLSLLQVEGALP